MQKGTEKQAAYLGYLDAARGIAAMMVVIYHFTNWKYHDTTWAKLISIAFNGADAVSFFFVLSGFVLSYKYIVLGHSMDVGKFYINRWLRLWPAFFLTVFINAMYWYRHNLNFGYLVNQFIFNQSQFWNEAILIRPHPTYYVPGWTLVIELAMSFMIPFFVVIGLKHCRLLLWLSLVFLFVGGGNMGDWYVFHFNFVLGVLLSCYYEQIVAEDFRSTTWYRNRYLLLLIAAVLFSIRHINRLLLFPEGYFGAARWLGLVDFFPFTAVGSFIFLVFIIHNAAVKRVLQYGMLNFLGKISYSVYLMHWLPVMFVYDHWQQFQVYIPNTKLLFITTLAGVIIVTILSGWIVYKFVEIPFIRLGKRLTGRMRGTLVIENIKP